MFDDKNYLALEAHDYLNGLNLVRFPTECYCPSCSQPFYVTTQRGAEHLNVSALAVWARIQEVLDLAEGYALLREAWELLPGDVNAWPIAVVTFNFHCFSPH